MHFFSILFYACIMDLKPEIEQKQGIVTQLIVASIHWQPKVDQLFSMAF